ncbi:MAG: extracellular solute-binding protein [Clostridiales bacterium]|nr:extracellular solute-binding protein [Clostridiales bacterium]
MKKTLALVLSLVLLMAASTAMAAIEIDYWSVFTGGDGAVMQGMVDAFNASQDEVHVNHTPMTADDLYQKIPLTVQTGTSVPDVAIVHIERIPNFVDKEMLYPYDMELVAQAGIVPENYNQAAWERTDIDGEHYGIPLDVHGYITYINKDLFDKYDLNEFVADGYITFDEIRALGDKARANGFEGQIFDLGWMRAQLLGYYAQLAEGHKLTDDGVAISLDKEAMKTVMETMKSLYEDGYTTKKTDDYSSMFYGGELLVWSEGIWMKAAAVNAGINFEMYPAVCYSPETCKNWMSSHNFVQFADENRTEEEDLAVAKFINFMGENSLTWAKDAGQVPAHVSLNAVEEYASMPQAFLSDPERVDELAIYYYLHWGLFDTAFSRIGWDFVDGTISIDDAIAQVEQEVTDAIAAQ